MVSSEVSGLVVSFKPAGMPEVNGVLGETFLQTLGFDPSNTTRNIWVLIAFYGGFALLAVALFVARVRGHLAAALRFLGGVLRGIAR